jgi:hypothetical protein
MVMGQPAANRFRCGRRRLATVLAVVGLALAATPVAAQTAEAGTRTATIEQAQAAKASDLHPYVPNKAEKYLDYAETILTTGLRFHPYFQSAYSGGGFTLGAGYMSHLGSYNTLDVRGSITLSAYKRIEAEFLAPRLFERQARLSLIGGWREATEVGYYGIGSSTSSDDRANYGFQQPYGAATLDFRPANRALLLRGGFEASQWEQTPGSGSYPSVEQVFTPDAAPGLEARVTYLHSSATVGVDSRPSAGYARRGGFYGATLHDFTDVDGGYGFTQVDYEALQHIPLVREAWVLSFRGLVSTTSTKSDQQIPFFMLPALGGGSSLRGFSSWRFRDRHSLLLQAEWRVMVNRFVDLAAFYDTGKVAADRGDLDLSGLKNDYGLGLRFHGPLATPFRIDVAHGNEGLAIVWAASAAF